MQVFLHMGKGLFNYTRIGSGLFSHRNPHWRGAVALEAEEVAALLGLAERHQHHGLCLGGFVVCNVYNKIEYVHYFEN